MRSISLKSILFVFCVAQISVMASEPSTILAYGDSITAGGSGFPSYRKFLVPLLKKEEIDFRFVGPKKDKDSAHAGYPGKKTKKLRMMAAKVYGEYPADIVLVHSGHNSFSDKKPIPGIVKDTEEMIKIFQKINPKVKVLLAQVIPAGKLPKYSYIPELNRELKALAERVNKEKDSVIVVNLEEGFNWKTDTVKDRVHPNESGSRKMAEKWKSALVPLLKKP